MMTKSVCALSALLASSLLLSACENLPGSREDQATVIGGAAGAAVGAAVADNDLLGVLLGGAVGAAGGRIIGARTDWFEEQPDFLRTEAQRAADNARQNPATAADVARSNSADLNNDGFVTTDELLAMEAANLSDAQIMERLEATDQVFDLSEQQRQEFIAAGLSPEVVNGMENINRAEREELLNNPQVIGNRRA